MKRFFLILLSILVISCFLIAGCTQPAQKPVPVPETTLPVTIPATATPAPTQTWSLTPGPTRTVPDYEQVFIQVNRNPNTESPTITVIFNGGLGLGMTEVMAVKVVRSDGKVEDGRADHPQMGASITLMGTTTTDRVIVWVTMTSGETYTVFDQDMPFTNLA